MSSAETSDHGPEIGGGAGESHQSSTTAMATSSAEKWPSLFEEVAEMIVAAMGTFAIADLRALARKGKLAEGSDRVFDLPLGVDDVLSVMRANESVYSKTKSGDFHKLVEYYEHVEGEMQRKDMGYVHYVNDENAAEECVYLLNTCAARKRIVLAFRGSITINDWAKDAKNVIGAIPNPVVGMSSDQPDTVGIHLGFRDFLYGDAATILSRRSAESDDDGCDSSEDGEETATEEQKETNNMFTNITTLLRKTSCESSSQRGGEADDDGQQISEDGEDTATKEQKKNEHICAKITLPRRASANSSSNRDGEADDDGALGGGNASEETDENKQTPIIFKMIPMLRKASAESTSERGPETNEHGVGEANDDRGITPEDGEEAATEEPKNTKHLFAKMALPRRASAKSSSNRDGEADDGGALDGGNASEEIEENKQTPTIFKMIPMLRKASADDGALGGGSASEEIDENKQTPTIFKMVPMLRKASAESASERGPETNAHGVIISEHGDEENETSGKKKPTIFNKLLLPSKNAEEDEEPKQTKLERVLDQLQALMDEYPDYIVYITGHSLGGALALCTALEAAAKLRTESRPVTCITIGNPKSGDYAFRSAIEVLETRGVLRCLGVHNTMDIIPLLPDHFVTGSKNFCQVGMQMRLFNTHYQILRKGGEDDTMANKMSEDFACAVDNLKHGRFLTDRINKHNYREYYERIMTQEEELRQVYLNDLYREKVDASLYTQSQWSDALRDTGGGSEAALSE